MSRVYVTASMKHTSLGISLPVFSVETADHTGGGYHLKGIHPASLAAAGGRGPEIKKGERFDLKFNINKQRTSLALVINTSKFLPHVEWSSEGGMGKLPLGLSSVAPMLLTNTHRQITDGKVETPHAKGEGALSKDSRSSERRRLRESSPRRSSKGRSRDYSPARSGYGRSERVEGKRRPDEYSSRIEMREEPRREEPKRRVESKRLKEREREREAREPTRKRDHTYDDYDTDEEELDEGHPQNDYIDSGYASSEVLGSDRYRRGKGNGREDDRNERRKSRR